MHLENYFPLLTVHSYGRAACVGLDADKVVAGSSQGLILRGLCGFNTHVFQHSSLYSDGNREPMRPLFQVKKYDTF